MSGVAAFLGPFLLGVGPLVALFSILLLRKAFLVLLALASAFYWLMVLFVTAALLRHWTPLRDDAAAHAGALLLSVFVQQVGNYGLYRIHAVLTILLREAGRKLGRPFDSLDVHWLSLGMGFGHGATHSTFLFATLLEATSGEAALYDFDACPQLSLPSAAALISLGFALFHTFATVVFHEGMKNRDLAMILGPPLAHLLCSLATLSSFWDSGCMISIPFSLMAGVGSAVWAGCRIWAQIQRQFPVTSFP